MPNHPIRPLLRHMSVAIPDITEQETGALLGMKSHTRVVSAGTDFVKQLDAPAQCTLVTSGIVCRSKVSGSGRRQIVAIHVLGEFPDLSSLYLGSMDHTIATLTECALTFVPHEELDRVMTQQPRIARYLWRETLVESSIALEWMLNVGSRTGEQRMAHLLCELNARQTAVGLHFGVHMSQTTLGEVLGLSLVHTNRSLGALKRRGLITGHGTKIGVPDWDALAEAGDFDPLYLHHRASQDMLSPVLN